MKKFNLERALAGDPVVTRNGRKILQIYCERNCSINNPVVGFVEGKGWKSFDVDGKYGDYHYDLFMAPVKKEGWANLYRNSGTHEVYLNEHIFNDEQSAKKIGRRGPTYIKTIKIEWDE